MGIEGDKSYNPNPVVVQEGQTILWVNGDAISHTVTSNSHKNGLKTTLEYCLTLPQYCRDTFIVRCLINLALICIIVSTILR